MQIFLGASGNGGLFYFDPSVARQGQDGLGVGVVVCIAILSCWRLLHESCATSRFQLGKSCDMGGTRPAVTIIGFPVAANGRFHGGRGFLSGSDSFRIGGSICIGDL